MVRSIGLTGVEYRSTSYVKSEATKKVPIRLNSLLLFWATLWRNDAGEMMLQYEYEYVRTCVVVVSRRLVLLS